MEQWDEIRDTNGRNWEELIVNKVIYSSEYTSKSEQNGHYFGENILKCLCIKSYMLHITVTS